MKTPNELIRSKFPEYEITDYGLMKFMEEIMEEFAQQQSVQFNEWVRERFNPSQNDKWVDFSGRNEFTSGELYKLWKEQ